MLDALRPILLAAAVTLASVAPVLAEPCPAETFDAAVDGAGAALRAYNGASLPKLRERLKALSEKRGWSAETGEDQALEELSDARTAELDATANDLLSKIDLLGRPTADGKYDCAKLPELEAASIELLAAMKTKFAYLSDKLDRELGKSGLAEASAKPETPGASTGQKAETAPANKPSAVAPERAAPARPTPPAKVEAPERAPPRNAPESDWDTTTAAQPAPQGAPQDPATTALLPPEAAGPLPDLTFETGDDGYTIDEIRDATRGFFGTISTNLASVIEHAFASIGRPTAYVLGKEGGGAFLAGLRYGSGTLYLRQGGTQPIFWHGPSLGYDVGADGGRTLILVYSLTKPEKIYRRFTGIDGSAYLVGGVGMTLLKGGHVIMAPIRSGVGVRLGANLGYIRFTDRPTWNPF